VHSRKIQISQILMGDKNANSLFQKYFYFIHGNPAKHDLRKIMGKINYFQNLHLKIKSLENKKLLVSRILTARPFEAIFRV
jgi:hypothetical protein